MSKWIGLAFVACLTVIAMASPASAAPVKWTLQNVTFDDGAMAWGSFVYDISTNMVSDVDITTTSGLAVPGAHYTLVDPGFGPYPSQVVLVTGWLADFTGSPALSLVADFWNPGGILAANGGEFLCVDAGCTNGVLTRAIATGSFVGTGVPEPATLSLLVFGLMGLGLRGLRRRPAV